MKKSFVYIVDKILIDPTKKNFGLLISYIQNNKFNTEEICALVNAFVSSGKKLHFEKEKIIADIPSTGGPSSLSTIVCPLLFRSHNIIVPKLAIPGRPAGGIDILAQIPGYQINLTEFQVKKILNKCGYAHFITQKEFTPLDLALYNFRKKNNKVALPMLAIASILSKKIATGVTYSGLDIRIAKFNNFGKTLSEARHYAKIFCRVANSLGINAMCFMSNGEIPYQPYIGRGEALIALNNIVHGNIDPMSTKHFSFCYYMVLSVIHTTILKNNIIDRINNEFILNLYAQGSTYNKFIKKIKEIKSGHKYYYEAPHEGFLTVNMDLMRKVIVRFQDKLNSRHNLFPDPCGFILKKNSGDYVFKNEQIATYRCLPNIKTELGTTLPKIYEIKEEPLSYQLTEELHYA